MLPPSRATDVAVELAKQETLKEEQRTLQESERTEQLRIMASVANNNTATTQQALSILKHAIDNKITIANNDLRLSCDDIQSLHDEAASNLDRELIIKNNQECFSNIPAETERKLTSQLRKSINDLALPLRNSATGLNISQGSNFDNKIAFLNKNSAQSIASEIESDEVSTLRGSIKAYDVETGYGKFRYNELPKPITFRVPSASKQNLRSKITQAMDQEDVLITAFMVKDTYGSPTRIILDDILEDEIQDTLGNTE